MKKWPQFVESMFPQLASGSGTPMLRNEIADSRTMFAAQMIAKYTAIGPTRCGRMCVRTIRGVEAPTMRDASMKSCLRNCSTTARTIRAG